MTKQTKKVYDPILKDDNWKHRLINTLKYPWKAVKKIGNFFIQKLFNTEADVPKLKISPPIFANTGIENSEEHIVIVDAPEVQPAPTQAENNIAANTAEVQSPAKVETDKNLDKKEKRWKETIGLNNSAITVTLLTTSNTKTLEKEDKNPLEKKNCNTQIEQGNPVAENEWNSIAVTVALLTTSNTKTLEEEEKYPLEEENSSNTQEKSERGNPVAGFQKVTLTYSKKEKYLKGWGKELDPAKLVGKKGIHWLSEQCDGSPVTTRKAVDAAENAPNQDALSLQVKMHTSTYSK